MKQVALLDICHPDYFTGYYLPVIAVPVSGKVTNSEIADLIDGEINSTWDYLNPDNEAEVDTLYQAYTAKLRENPEDVFCELEEGEEDEECIYAYFSIINPVTVHGITFLNP